VNSHRRDLFFSRDDEVPERVGAWMGEREARP
jgi:hypothetical protein